MLINVCVCASVSVARNNFFLHGTSSATFFLRILSFSSHCKYEWETYPFVEQRQQNIYVSNDFRRLWNVTKCVPYRKMAG